MINEIYSLLFIKASLYSPRSVKKAELLLDHHDWNSLRDLVLPGDLRQVGTFNMSNHLCREIPSRLTTLFGYESDRLVYIRPQVQAFSRLVCWLLLYRNLGILGTNLLSCGGTPGKIAETARSDEIGQLAAAIERMGASIRLAMERLRKCA